MISLGDAIVSFRGDMTDLNKSLGDAQREVKKSLGNILNSAKQVGLGMTAMGAGILGGMGAAIQSFADAGSEAHDMAQKTGLSAEAVSELGYALKISGGDVSTLDSAMKGMAKSMDAAQTITGQLADTQDKQLNAAQEKGAELTDKYKDAIAKCTTQIQRIQAETARHVQQMRAHGESENAIAKYTAAMNEQIIDQKQKISDLTKEYGKASSNLSKNAEALMLNQDEAKGAALAYKRLGMDMEALKTMSPEQRFMALANAVASVKDPTERAALAMQVFKKGGADLLPLLSEGAEGIAKLRQEAKDLGYSFSTEDANAADELGDAIDKLKSGFFGMSKTIIVNLKPVLMDLMDWITKTVVSVTDWVKAHGPLTANLLKVAATVGIVMSVLGPFLILLPGLVSAFGLLSGLGGVAGLTAAFGLLLNPIGLTIGAVVILVPLLWGVMRAVTGVTAAEQQQAQSQAQVDAMTRQYVETLKRKGIAIDENRLKTMDDAQKAAYLTQQVIAAKEHETASIIRLVTGAEATKQQIFNAELARTAMDLDAKQAVFLAAKNYTTEQIKDMKGLSEEQKAAARIQLNTEIQAWEARNGMMKQGLSDIDKDTREMKNYLERLSLDHHESPSINDMVEQSLFGGSGFLAMLDATAQSMSYLLAGMKSMWFNAWDAISVYVSNAIARMKEWGVNALSGLGINTDGARATGGPITSSGVYQVGERGPETVYLPQGARVYTQGDMQRSAMGMGGPVNATVNVNVARMDASNPADVKSVAVSVVRELEVMCQRAFKDRGISLGAA